MSAQLLVMISVRALYRYKVFIQSRGVFNKPPFRLKLIRILSPNVPITMKNPGIDGHRGALWQGQAPNFDASLGRNPR